MRVACGSCIIVIEQMIVNICKFYWVLYNKIERVLMLFVQFKNKKIYYGEIEIELLKLN